MFIHFKKPYLFFCALLSFALAVGCIPTLGGKALSPVEPISDPDLIVDIYKPHKIQKPEGQTRSRVLKSRTNISSLI
jgi:hypothetical protein